MDVHGIVLALSWNSFVAVTGSLLPLVWPKFIDVGMSEWPYLAIFLWVVPKKVIDKANKGFPKKT